MISHKIMLVTHKYRTMSSIVNCTDDNVSAAAIRTIRFCRLVIECDAISLLMDDAGNADHPSLNARGSVWSAKQGRRQVKQPLLFATVPARD